MHVMTRAARWLRSNDGFDPEVGLDKQQLTLSLIARMTTLATFRLGPQALSLAWKVILHRGGEVGVSVDGLAAPVILRLETSDLPTFAQIFVLDEYAFATDIEPALVIDGGANIGCASLDFARRFPGAKIIAVEPEESNFALLERNTTSCPDIQRVRGALWSSETWLRVKPGFETHWACQVEACEEDTAGAFRATTIDQLLEASGHERIDVLKLDVEGAESEIFGEGCRSWLDRTDLLIIELSESLRPGCTAVVDAATERSGMVRVPSPREDDNGVAYYVRPPHQVQP